MNTLHTLSITLGLIVFLSFGASAQLNENKQPRMVDSLNHSIGFHAGLTTGVGLSYRFRPNKFGVQATFGPLKTEEKTQLNAGVSFIYVLFMQDDFKFFLYQGKFCRSAETKKRRGI
ncbi:MAG: hypothetical protein ACI923_002568 [Flavobacteriales bacterium]|jgi:hypothetical protein